MEEKDNSAAPQERRQDPRFAVDAEASLFTLNSGMRLACRIVEISLTGCRMVLRDRFNAGTPARVEMLFALRGFSFRFNGETEWTDGQNQVGIRFAEMTSRRRDELVEVLCEIAAETASTAVKEAAERLAAEDAAQKHPDKASLQRVASSVPAVQSPEAQKPSPAPDRLVESATKLPALSGSMALPDHSARLAAQSGASPQAPAQSSPQAPAKATGRERRTQSRHEVDTSATILLVNVASRIQGRILNLSLGGCRIRTEERFPVGIYTRVEAEFHLEGLAFRLGGVVQAIQDRRHVGIRFLDMSERKREQVEQLIAEIDALRVRQDLAQSSAANE